MEGDSEQFNGREGETATFIWRCPSNFSLRVIGFAPRQFGRSALHQIFVTKRMCAVFILSALTTYE